MPRGYHIHDAAIGSRLPRRSNALSRSAGPSYGTILVPWLDYLLVLAITLYLLLSTQILVILRWHYAGGGSGIEKLHPATYLLCLILPVIFTLNSNFRRLFVRRLTSDRSIWCFVAAVFFTAFYAIVFGDASAAPFVDTFFAAIVVVIILTCLPDRPFQFFRLLVDVIFLINIVTIFAELVLHQDFVAPYVQAVIRTPEEMVVIGGQSEGGNFGRLSAFFGHPLNAALLFGVYSIGNLVSMPMRLSMPAMFRLGLSLASYLAIFPTQSRSSMVATTIILGLYLCYFSVALWARRRLSPAGLAFALALLVVLACFALALWGGGYFDKMLLRFEYNSGSSLARDYATEILTTISTSGLWFGLSQTELNTLQSSFGLIAVEIAWVNFILVGGLIVTIPLLVTFFFFLFGALPKYCNFGIYFVSALIFESTFASNSIWAKTTVLTSSLMVGLSLCRRGVQGSQRFVSERATSNQEWGPPGRAIRQRIQAARETGAPG